MTGFFLTKTRTRRLLTDACLQVLEREGWTLSKVSGFGNARIRRLVRDGKSKLAAIRTTQDQWIAFPRTQDDTKWATLSEVDAVVVASVDPDDPKVARVHMIDANELRRRFDRAYAARRNAGYSIPVGRGVWIALYENEVSDPVTLVGAGAGIANAPIARVPLAAVGPPTSNAPAGTTRPAAGATDDGTLTIAEAKARLARTLGVDPSNIKITVEA
ncbi:MAG: hypothetical protein OXH75_23685 [Acidobacteria bacterium]|nr:hypothetical protein [Acidobacteriota bacterium]